MFIDEALGEDRERELCKLGAFHLLGGKEEVSNVSSEEASSGCGHHAVEQEFRSVEFSSSGRDLMGVVDAVSTNRTSHSTFNLAVLHLFFAYGIKVGNIFLSVAGNRASLNWVHSLRSGNELTYFDIVFELPSFSVRPL